MNRPQKTSKKHMKRKIVIQKVDLDTALTALLLGVSKSDEIVVVRDKATNEDLANPDVICVECGSSGQVDSSNFDHHDTDQQLPSACIQALHTCDDQNDDLLKCLAEYVAILDIEGPEGLKARSKLPKDAFPTLSDVFSEMLLVTREAKEQLLNGMAILKTVLEQQLDPFDLMPKLPGWCDHLEAKRKNNEAIRFAVEGAKLFETKGGLKAGLVETTVIGALGELYKLGCVVAIAYSPKFGNPPAPKYTVAGNGVRVDSLLLILNEQELGWGGPVHGTIIGSPRTGSKLKPEEMIAVVREHL